MGKYTKTHSKLDSTDLALQKVKELTTVTEALLAKLDSDGLGGKNYVSTLGGQVKNPDKEFVGQDNA